MHEGAHADRAAGANRHGARLIGAVLLGIALENRLLIERALIPDDGQRRLGDEHAVVEHALAEPDTDQPPQHALEWRSVEQVQEVDRMQLPHALDPPKAAIVDGADGRRWWAERLEEALHQRVVDRGGDSAEREEHRRDGVREHAVDELEGSQVDQHDKENTKPARGEKNADRRDVEPILRREAAAQRFARPQMVESAVALDGARNLEGW